MKQMLLKIFRVICLLVVFAAIVGCIPKQIISERVVVKTDSTAVFSLKSEIKEKDITIAHLKSEIERFREENTELQNEVSTHTIHYDTTAQVKPDGDYPVAWETITQSKSSLSKQLKERETEISELRRENVFLTVANKNLDYEISQVREENRQLQSKIITVGFWDRAKGYVYGSFLGILIGCIAGALLWQRFGKRLRELWVRKQR